MKGILRLGKKEARDVLRERTIVLALAVQLFVAAFSAFLAVGLVALYSPAELGASTEMEVAYAGEGGFDEQIADRDVFEVVEIDAEEGLAAFRQGRVDALVVEADTNTSEPRRVQMRVPEGELRTTLLINELKSALDEYEHELRLERSDRLTSEVLRVDGPASPPVAFSFAYGVLLPLLVAAPVFLAGAVTADGLSDEINERTLPLLRASPLSATEIVLGKLITPVLLVPGQVLLWMGLLWANGIPTASPFVVLLAATLLGTILAACGILTATWAQREGLTQAAYTVVVLALSGLALLLPQDPANLIARAGVGTLSVDSLTTLIAYGIGAVVLLAFSVHWVGRRMAQDRLQPGAG